MGQALPLPERIPMPSQKDKEQLLLMGFSFYEEENTYIGVNLPEGFRWHNDSLREDIPVWYVVDQYGLSVLCVSGGWKGSYDNCLRIRVYDTPKLVEFSRPRNQSYAGSKPSETSGDVLFCTALDAGVHKTPEGRNFLNKALNELP